MNQKSQWLLVGLLFIGAIIYLILRIQKSSKGETCEGASCNCKPGVSMK